MDRKIAVFTVFTFLLFAVSGARILLDPPAIDLDLPVVKSSDDEYKKTKYSTKTASAGANLNIILPSEMQESSSDGTDRVPESEKDRTVTIDVTPRPDFARFLPINRHFLDESTSPLRFIHRRPYRHFVSPFMIHRSEISYGNDVILPREIDNVGSETLHRQAPLKRLRFKHDYGHRHHRHHRHGNNGGFVPKHVLDREKLKSLARQHREKNREHEAGFMKSIRKFLKHTFY